MSFEAAIAAGFDAAESAWGCSWSPEGSALIYTGTFDKLDDRSAPKDGGYLFEWDSTLVCSRAQFATQTITDTTGLPILDTTGAALVQAQDPIDEFTAIGKKVVILGRTYRIIARQDDGYTIDLMLKSQNR
jgi:hypothetical protein